MTALHLIRRRLGVAAVAATLPIAVVAPAAAQTPVPDEREARPFLIDVAHDYRNMVSWESAQWLAIGGVLSLAVAEADEALRAATEDPDAPVTRAVEPGGTYGNMTIQLPLAIGWWAVSHAAGSGRGAAAGRDLLRAQISAFSWTYAIKYAVDRERPNGDPRSFPSGHSSATFAAAMVFQQHYGWKAGVPLFAAATYTAASRITVNKHWASDVAFGAVLGMVSGRTVTLHLRRARFTVSPVRTAGGAAIVFTKS
jgi:membrane-associated phospholipid phosphatase